MSSTIEKVWRWLTGGAAVATPSAHPAEPARPGPDGAADAAAGSVSAGQGARAAAGEAAAATHAAPVPPDVPASDSPIAPAAADEEIEAVAPARRTKIVDAKISDARIGDANGSDTEVGTAPVAGDEVSSAQVGDVGLAGQTGRAASAPPDQDEIQRRRELVRTLFNDFWSGRDDKPAAFVDRLNEAETYLNERLSASGEIWQLDAATRKMLGLPARSPARGDGHGAVHR